MPGFLLRRRVQVPAIQALVALGCPVAVQDSVNSTPVHVAAGEGNLAAVVELCRLVRRSGISSTMPAATEHVGGRVR